MCVQNYRRSKSTRPSSVSSQNQKRPKHIKTIHPEASTETKAQTETPSVNVNVTAKRKKSVSFNEVVMVQPHFHRAVDFDEVVMVRPVLHLSEYTDQEIVDCWYVLADKKLTKIDILNTLKLAKENNTNKNCCTRGLEKLSDGGRTRERRRLSIREILEEQESQRIAYESSDSQSQPFVYNVTKFRKTYRPHSRAARHAAHAMGKIDEMSAQSNQVPHTCTRKCKPRRNSICSINSSSSSGMVLTTG